MNTATFLNKIASYRSDNICAFDLESEYTYELLLDRVSRLHTALHGLGVQPGDRVVLMLPNHFDFIVGYFGIMQAGATVVAVNYMNRRYEVEHILQDAQPKALICEWRNYEGLSELLGQPEFEHIKVLATDTADEAKLDFHKTLDAANPASHVAERQPDDEAVIIYTSAHEGGVPRGAILTHGNIQFSAEIAAFEYAMTRHHVHLGALPLYHAYGQIDSLLCSIVSGATIALMPRFSASDIVALHKKRSITHWAMVPAMAAMLIPSGDIEDNSFAGVEFMIIGGAKLPQIVQEGFANRFGVSLMEGYGLTECSPTVSYQRTELKRYYGTVGRPMPGVAARVVAEDGSVLPIGETGEIQVQGKNVFKGYLNHQEFTDAKLRDNWLSTGDEGHINERGEIVLTGLKKNMFLVGGFNVYPEEVQRLAANVPDIEGIRLRLEEDFIMGTIATGIVKVVPGGETNPRTLRRKLSEVMSMYKVPKRIEVVEELPEVSETIR